MAAPTPENHHRRHEVFVFDDVTYKFCSLFATVEWETQEALSCCGLWEWRGHSGLNLTRQQFYCALVRACHIAQNTLAHRLIVLAGRRTVHMSSLARKTVELSHLTGACLVNRPDKHVIRVITVYTRDRFCKAALRSDCTLPKSS